MSESAEPAGTVGYPARYLFDCYCYCYSVCLITKKLNSIYQSDQSSPRPRPHAVSLSLSRPPARRMRSACAVGGCRVRTFASRPPPPCCRVRRSATLAVARRPAPRPLHPPRIRRRAGRRPGRVGVHVAPRTRKARAPAPPHAPPLLLVPARRCSSRRARMRRLHCGYRLPRLLPGFAARTSASAAAKALAAERATVASLEHTTLLTRRGACPAGGAAPRRGTWSAPALRPPPARPRALGARCRGTTRALGRRLRRREEALEVAPRRRHARVSSSAPAAAGCGGAKTASKMARTAALLPAPVRLPGYSYRHQFHKLNSSELHWAYRWRNHQLCRCPFQCNRIIIMFRCMVSIPEFGVPLSTLFQKMRMVCCVLLILYMLN